jgi:hypothetical protein
MLLLFLASTAAIPAQVVAPAPLYSMGVIDTIHNRATCPPISRYEAAKRGGKLKPQFLDELPPADVYKAVYRRVGGCVSPVIAKFGIGR